MALFKKNQTTKKSSGAGLFKKHEPAKTYPAPPVPEGDFATTEDSAHTNAPMQHQHHDDRDSRFLAGEQMDVASSRVSAVQYDRHNHRLRVTMQDGATCVYEMVPGDVALGLLHATSPGRYVAQQLSRYSYTLA